MATDLETSAERRTVARLLGLFTPAEWGRLAAMYGFIAFLHVLGWALFAGIAAKSAAFAGAGLIAYTLGMRHGFDADHISAVDDTTRYLLAKGRKPLSVGFFFSFGHSSVVFVLSLALALAAKSVQSRIPGFQDLGSTIGASVSGTFLWIIGLLNLAVLLGILKVWRQAKRGDFDRQQLDHLLLQRSLVDTTDGALMTKAYGWAFASPLRKLWYNLTTTGLSVAVALVVGTIELLQVLSDRLGWKGAFFEFLNERLDFGVIGYTIVAIFLGAWLLSVVLWRVRRVEERYGDILAQSE